MGSGIPNSHNKMPLPISISSSATQRLRINSAPIR